MPEKPVGKVEHYYPKAKAAAVGLTDDLKVGDDIHIVGHGDDVRAKVKSLQLDHVPIQEGHAGQHIGVGLATKVHEGDDVLVVRGGGPAKASAWGPRGGTPAKAARKPAGKAAPRRASKAARKSARKAAKAASKPRRAKAGAVRRPKPKRGRATRKAPRRAAARRSGAARRRKR